MSWRALKHLGWPLAVAGLAAALLAHAAVFQVIAATPDVVTVLDPTAIEPVGDGGVKRAWTVSVQRVLVSGGPQQPGYVRTLNEYDCANLKVRWVRFAVYSRFGAPLLRKENDDQTWAAPRNREAAVAASLICDNRQDGDVVAADTIGKLVIGLMQAWDEAAPLPPLQPTQPMPGPARPAPRHKAATPPATPKDKTAAPH